ncbi:threonine-phosphate decarboxylase CobD [Candidatus Methanocrinis natronophilus]|uniref:threonine-phosphate decarboxylase n=1 Tax=Candidatus Methanocrinis natronophilus TaxID=3033396 RepID=A0ABT5X9L0_9EURY|nr:threonine-phosphate decarboxylase CobD [Candidatus Methanocrinis natronophilus]MDF0591353.1 threonine-phosphate decarboxylase CobD [Candidatus Methanocrinis natronophilus]
MKIRDSFAGAEACHHGGRIRSVASSLELRQEDLLDYSANINPLGHPPLDDLILREMKGIGHYPDNDYVDFRTAAAGFVGVEAENVVPGNGSSELMRLFAEALMEPGDMVVITEPTFGEYAAQSRLFGAEIVPVPRGIDRPVDPKDFLSDALLEEARAVFICNPNNPTGILLPRSMIHNLAERCERAETFLFVDEAFIELSDPAETVADVAPGMEHLFVARSLTKSFGVPGIRLGFGVAGDSLVGVMNRTRLPWSISSLASAAGAHLLSQGDHLVRSRHVIKEELAWLTGELERLGLDPVRSSVNFILVGLGRKGIRSSVLVERMVGERVLVRDCRSFGLGEGYVRVAVRNREENERFVSALERVLGWRG